MEDRKRQELEQLSPPYVIAPSKTNPCPMRLPFISWPITLITGFITLLGA